VLQTSNCWHSVTATAHQIVPGQQRAQRLQHWRCKVNKQGLKSVDRAESACYVDGKDFCVVLKRIMPSTAYGVPSADDFHCICNKL
jgi:hypothetical protein